MKAQQLSDVATQPITKGSTSQFRVPVPDVALERTVILFPAPTPTTEQVQVVPTPVQKVMPRSFLTPQRTGYISNRLLEERWKDKKNRRKFLIFSLVNGQRNEQDIGYLLNLKPDYVVFRLYELKADGLVIFRT